LFVAISPRSLSSQEDRIMKGQFILTASLGLLLTAVPASAAVTVTQQAAPAPTYSITLNFDEVGGPVGLAPTNAWNLSHGITLAQGGASNVQVNNYNGSFAWLPNNNAAFGPFGLFWNFSTDMTEMSFQAWDTSGPATPFGGGMAVVLFDNGAEVGSTFVSPAWGGVGNTWYNITTSAGSVFDEVRVLGFGFSPDTYMDNMSWNVVPGPGGLMMLAVAGLVGPRRRRH
jgi:hypothetical protein